jgi:hypothetical protein
LNPFFSKTGFAIKEFCLNEPKREREREKKKTGLSGVRDRYGKGKKGGWGIRICLNR